MLAHVGLSVLAVQLWFRDAARVRDTLIARARAGWAQETQIYDLCPIDWRAPRSLALETRWAVRKPASSFLSRPPRSTRVGFEERIAMMTARRLGLLLLLIACAPLIMALSGGPSGLAFQDLNNNGVQDPGEPGLVGWDIHVFDPATKALLLSMSTIASNVGPPPTEMGSTPSTCLPGTTRSARRCRRGGRRPPLLSSHHRPRRRWLTAPATAMPAPSSWRPEATTSR